jgi:serine protease
MTQRRWSFAALALAPILALGACDQLEGLWQRVRGEEAETSAQSSLEAAPLEARALSGSVRPQDEMAALLAPEPVLVAPGEILVGAAVEQQLDDVAGDMGLASNFVRNLRTRGMDALEQLPENVMEQVRQRAESEAGATARTAARDVLLRLGIQGEVNVRPGGVVTIDLAPNGGVSPTSLAFAQQSGDAASADAPPPAVEWNAADQCPRVVTQRAMEQDLALATRCAILRLQASGQFEYVEPNYIAASGFSWPRRPTPPPNTQAPNPPTPTPTNPAPQPAAGGLPNDPLLGLQWHYRPRGTGEGQSPGGAGFIAYWQAHQIGSRNVRVAVLDTGLDLNHPDIRASQNVVAGIDLISNVERAGDADGVDSNAQDEGDRCGAQAENSYHGTHVAGTIGAEATNDSVGVAGGAWSVGIVPVRVLGRCGGELADIVSGIRWAAGIAPAIGPGGTQIANANPADIINMSLTIQAPCPASMQAAIDAAAARDVVVVVAAGNKADQASRFAPANCNNVLVVAANDARGDLAFYSNFGPQVDIMAPGGDVFADSDSDGRPDGVLSTRATTSGCYDPLNQNSTSQCYYSFLQGTSMATPHVSAALALLAAETGLRGQALETALFTRAMAPLPDHFGQIECTRARNATPISTGSATCARPAGRGALDLARAVPTIAATPTAAP